MVHLSWRRPVRGFKYRPRQSYHETFSEKGPQIAGAIEEPKVDTTFQQPGQDSTLFLKDTCGKSALPRTEITIEQYILSKKQAACNSDLSRGPLPTVHQEGGAHHTAINDSVMPANLTISAQDEAYSYLFQNLSGNCHGLNLVTYPASSSGGEDGKEKNSTSSPSPSSSACVRIAVIVYVKSGTACRNWEGIEMGLERIFKNAATKNDNTAAWKFEGVTFEVWEAT